MSMTSLQVEAPARAVPAASAPKARPAAWYEALVDAQSIALTLESLALGALALVSSATPKGREDRRQLDRARLALACLPDACKPVADLLDAPGGFEKLSREQAAASLRELEILSASITVALRTLEAVDTHGDLHGAGAKTIHADMLLQVTREQIERVKELVGEAIMALDLAELGVQ